MRACLHSASDTEATCAVHCAGELAIQCSPEQLQPFAAPIVERLVPILAAPMAQMPRSIVENRSVQKRCPLIAAMTNLLLVSPQASFGH